MKPTIRIKMTKAIYATAAMLLFSCSTFAQSVVINADGSSPNSTVCSEAVVGEKQATGIY